MRIIDCWRRNAERFPDRDAIVFRRAGEDPVRLTFASLLAGGEARARAMRQAGITGGDVCALIVRQGPELFPLYVGVKLAGAIPAVLAPPNARLHPDKFREGLAGMARRSGLDWILTSSDLTATVEPLVTEPGSMVHGVLDVDALPDEASRANRIPDSAAASRHILQHSSGTTGLQKAVVLPDDVVLRHLESYARSIALDDDDRIASWLPLYHDMGLIAAFHLPLHHGITSVQLDPFEWVVAPVLLLEAMSEERATISWLPNFAFNLIAERTHDDEVAALDLSHVKALINCSEPIRASSHRVLLERLAPAGLKPEAIAASYAMAETTFAVTQTEVGLIPTVLRVDRDSLRSGVVTILDSDTDASRECVSSGTPIPGCSVSIVDDEGATLSDGHVGELLVSSEFMFDGYRNWPEKTAEAMRDGWYLTGDLGFRWSGEIFVSGRKKDLIIVAGRNIYPEDLEDAVNSVDGVIPGRVVAFGIGDDATGTEKIVVVAETDRGANERRTLERSIKAAVAALDVTVAEVHLVEPRWLIKSSAGKPSRSANKARITAMKKEAGE